MAGYNRCLYQLQQGKNHPAYPGGSWKICVTPNQHKTLFGPGIPLRPSPKRLGGGVFAGVYGRDADTVVKITRDKSDVDGLNLVQETDFVPKVFATYRLTSPARWSSEKYASLYTKPRAPRPEVYAMVVERLTPLQGKDKREINAISACIQDKTRRGGYDDLAVDCCQKAKKVRSRAATSKLGNSPASCSTDVQRLADMYSDFSNYDIAWKDMHGGNFGRDRNGKLKVLDLGVSAKAQPYAEHEGLDGARHTKKRRR